MSGIVVYGEACKPITRKRVFEVKLKGAPLCMLYDDMLDNFDLMLEAEIFSLVKDDEGFVVNRHAYIVFRPKNDDPPALLKVEPGNRFTIGDLGGERQIWKIL